MKKLFVIIILSLLSFSLFANEKITSFNEKILLSKDRSAEVDIFIDAYAEHVKIRHGIYLDFYEKWKDEYGKMRRYKIRILRVKRDGRTEPYHVTSISNGFRIYIGSKNRYVSVGKHKYEILLRVERMVQDYGKFDELYWNVVGRGWQFPILSASAEVFFPEQSTKYLLLYRGYSGNYMGREWRGEIEKRKNVIYFKTDNILGNNKVFTIAISWKKGFFAPITVWDDLKFYVGDHFGSLLLLLLLLLYYLIIWSLVGKDPKKGTIIPLYYPPKGVSPGAARYILKMGYDNKVLVSDIVDMAVKGYVTIEQDEDGEYKLVRTNKTVNKEELLGGEQKLLEVFFERGPILRISKSNALLIQEAIRKYHKTLKNTYEGKYFISNLKYFIVGVVITLAVLAKGALEYTNFPLLIFMSVWLLIWTIGVVFLTRSLALYFSAFMETKRGKDFLSFAGMLLFCLPFWGGEFFAFFIIIKATDIYFPLLVLISISLNIIFYYLLKAPTRLGRKIMDEIEGFKLYLEVAEKERLDALIEKMGLEKLYETYLPYAIALGVEKKWGEKFDMLLAEAGKGEYSPTWYHGAGYFAPSMLGGVLLGGLNSSFASATPSSSASGGGGGAGGGGGGGGGGGW